MSWSKIFHALLPPKADDDPHPWRVSVFFWLILLIVVTMFSFLADYGRLSWVGVQPALRSDQVDQKIVAATKPIVEELESSGRKIEAAGRKADAVLIAIYLPQIRAKVRERCDTNDRRERAEINAELDRIKAEYRRLAGEAFGTDPACSEV